MKKICFLNDGCGIHINDFRQIFKSIEGEYELTDLPNRADVIIQYFCAITQTDAVSTIFHELLYLSKIKKNEAILIVCGCGVEVVGKEFFLNLDFVDYVVDSKNITEEISRIMKFNCVEEYYMKGIVIEFAIDIVEGCHKKHGWCSFCKQHYMKRKVKSKPMDEICKIATDITANDSSVIYISLTGLNICNYGIDFGDRKPKLHILIKELSKIPTIKHINLYSLTVESMYEELICEIESNPKVNLVELGIQSGSNHMHEVMNTGATVDKIQDLLNRFAHKSIRSIVVVSHPGETEEDLQETVEFIKKNNLWYIIVSEYKNSEGTPSYKMEQLDEETYNRHLETVSNVVEELKRSFLNGIINSNIVGYITKYIYYTEEDMARVFINPKEFNGGAIAEIEKFSISPYKKIFEESENGVMVQARVARIWDYEDARLIVEDLEVIK